VRIVLCAFMNTLAKNSPNFTSKVKTKISNKLTTKNEKLLKL